MNNGRIAPLIKSITVVSIFSLVLGMTQAHAAKPPSCTITQPQNSPVSLSSGGSVIFKGIISGGVAPYNVTWTFDGGTPPSANESGLGDGQETLDYLVVYNVPGSYTTTLSATETTGRRPKSCQATFIVNVAGENNPPIAQNDEYNTRQDIALNINDPGVLGNDNDPDGDPITAVMLTATRNGNLSLNSGGGFEYTPNSGFTGSDSFTYQATDAGSQSNPATVTIGVAAANAVSINSTSANGTAVAASPVAEQPIVPNTDFAVLATNDLGMHCGDLDTRISSILPPFNVLHAQVVQRGNGGLPRILNEGEVTLEYSAASNPNDPAIAKAASGQALSSVAADGSVYKTNFWDIAFQAYDPFYPDNVLDLFYDPNNPAANVDIGLPVPDVERFYLEDGELHASQQFMPGILGAYTNNDPQEFHEHIGNLPFFINFPFGYTASPNFFEAPGVPIAAFDDSGRENPYPLVRVQAKQGGTPIASLDIVMPISGEAECQACHSADVGNGAAISNLTDVAIATDDPLYNEDPSDKVPFEVAIEWASDINILRLHDQKHGTTLETGFDAVTGKAAEPVVCQKCHYTPALDLAQLGPLGPENDFSADFANSNLPGGILSSPSVANGRDQVKHKSMSNVMHSHHDTTGLFPTMPPAINAQGKRRDPVVTQTILEETCYMCHPGRRTQCMRGAMAKGGLVCQDCHGQMDDVGDDFTRNVSTANPGGFELGADFYDNPATPRVPWANEPGCGSCHTGYATDNLAGDPNVLTSPADIQGNNDGIRLLAAYRQNDPKATPIVPTNKAFAENVVAEGTAADGNPKLYRVSTGHGGLMCEGCHGSTHAEWPSANPNANDNIPASQLQGHSGYIAQCQVCHEPNDVSLPLGNNGPHGMHAIADLEPNLGVDGIDNGTNFLPDDRWNRRHRNYRNQGPGCESCHGADLKGTVLSRTADERTVSCKDSSGSLPECAAGQPTAIIPKGTPVGCGLCHKQK